MNILNRSNPSALLRAASLAVLVSACASAPQPSDDLERAKATFAEASQSSDINRFAAVELRRAQEMLDAAESAWNAKEGQEEIAHRAYMVERQTQIAAEAARTKSLDNRAEALRNERERVQLEARMARAERDAAQARAEKSRAEADRLAEEAQRLRAEYEAESARAERMVAEARAEELERETREMREQAERLKRQVAELEARPTDRGLVLTLGSDVLFDFDSDKLRDGGERAINRIAEFLDEYQERQLLVEGFTDSTGSREYNLALSERRANAVRTALIEKGVAENRVRTRGFGPDYPVASNDTDAGRQLNRRVEVVISDDEQRVPERED